MNAKMNASSADLPSKTEHPDRLKPRALYEEVAELLRQRIFSGTLLPGAWIDELTIAQEVGISRTPLREALKVLATEGLITMKMRRGAYVTETSQGDVANVFHLLALLEADAAAIVAEHASDSDLASLQALHQDLETAATGGLNNREAFFSINEQFHLRLLAIAKNRWRDQIVADLRKVMKLNRAQSLLKSGRITESLAEHRAIMAALQSRNAPLAAQTIRAHIRNGYEAAI